MPLAAASVLGVLLVRAVLDDGSEAFRWSMGTAYVGLAWLGASLAVGPLNVLRRRPNPLSSDVRRDIGIWAGLMSVAHTLAGLQVHMAHRSMYWVLADPISGALTLRTDAFGVTNHAGLIAGAIAAALLALSNDLAVRRLGLSRWKQLQRWNYALYALVLGHAAIYQLLEQRDLAFLLLTLALTLPILAMQFAGFRRRAGQARR